MSERVLFVDDEKPVLDACRRALRRKVEVDVALGGQEALAKIASDGPYAVIVSDMRMPVMTGVQLLSQVKEVAPDTVRMMLTGNSDQQTAIDAVNEGDIFRFMNKPCPPEVLLRSVTAGIAQHRLLIAEQELLENTLQGAIQVLADVLALVNPEAFGRTTRTKEHVRDVAERLEADKLWQFETMAMLSQIGWIAVPDAVQAQVLANADLSAEDQAAFDRHSTVAADLLTAIPRLDVVADAIRHQHTWFADGNAPDGEDIPLGGRILHAVLDFEREEALGVEPSAAMAKLRDREGRYDPRVLDALDEVIGAEAAMTAVSLRVERLTGSMRIAEDVKTKQGALVVCKGQAVTESLRMRLRNFARNGVIAETVLVWAETPDWDKAAP